MCIALNAMIASNTARAVLQSPLVLQTIIIAQMVSLGGKGGSTKDRFAKSAIISVHSRRLSR